MIAAPKGSGVDSRCPTIMMLAVGLEPTPLALLEDCPSRSARHYQRIAKLQNPRYSWKTFPKQAGFWAPPPRASFQSPQLTETHKQLKI